ncbi:MAG: DUF3048 domain-containing protein [Anaerolineae bacterium]|nr:DUF3048 domain-containing protein [Anaerolineae bacterium]
MRTQIRRALLLLVLCATLALGSPLSAQEGAAGDIIGPDTYPEGVNPLTGQPVSNPAVLNRRPVGVKVSNFPGDKVRPQAGLAQADIVFEHYAEGGTTRFTAFFLSTTPQKVGSMRSARLIDLELTAMYRALFIFSGASEGVRQRLYDPNRPTRARTFYADTMGDPFVFRDADIDPPHNFFANPRELWFLADERGVNLEDPGLRGTAFSATIPGGGAPARIVDIAYRAENVRWFYEGGFARYARYADGEPHMDAVTEQQITAQNVVVLYVDHVEDRTILEDEVSGGHYSTEIQLWGEGPCDLFRDGQRFECRWSRADDFSMLTFKTPGGDLLPLKPGITWYQIVPYGFTGLTVTP